MKREDVVVRELVETGVGAKPFHFTPPPSTSLPAPGFLHLLVLSIGHQCSCLQFLLLVNPLLSVIIHASVSGVPIYFQFPFYIHTLTMTSFATLAR